MGRTAVITSGFRGRGVPRTGLVAAVLLPLTLLVGPTPAEATPAGVAAAVAPPGSLLPGNDPTDEVVLFSARSAGTIDGVEYDAADVVRVDRSGGPPALVLDGSDIGLTGGLDGLAVLSDGSLLLSPDVTFSHPDVGVVEPEDVVRLVPTSLGTDTAGTLEWLLDGSDVGRSQPGADVNSIAVAPDGRLLVSTSGPSLQDTFLAKGQDLVSLEDARFGADSGGRWAPYFVGKDIGLRSSHDRVSASSINAATGGDLFLVTEGRTTPPAVAADNDQVMRCSPTSLWPQATSCALSLFQDFGIELDALHVGTASWLDEGCEAPTFEVEVTSHADGEVVDAGEDGTGTGSFLLSGRAPVAATSVVVEVAGETGPAELVDTGCGVTWAREVAGYESASVTFTVTSTGPTGVHQDTVDLDVVAPDVEDVLVQPAFADTPKLQDRLISYDSATGDLVFSGDATGLLEPGDGLGGGPSEVAPEGYLRIVVDVVLDGTTTRVSTRQSGLTELVRQVDVDYSVAPGDVEPLVYSTGDEAAPVSPLARTATSAVASSLIPISDDTDIDLDFQLDPGLDFELDIDWSRNCWLCLPAPTLERVWFEGSLELTAQVVLLHRAFGVTTGERPFGPRYDDLRLGGLTIPTPIGVPIVLTFEAEGQAFYDLALSAALKVEYGVSVSVAAGFEYEADGSGRGTYNDADFDGSAPSLDDVDLGVVGQASAGLEMDFEVLLYGQGGIEIEARPQLELEVIGDVIERSVDWELALVVPVDGNLEVEIEIGPLEWSREFGDLNFVTLTIVLFSGTFVDGDGGGGDPGDLGLDATLTGPPGAFPGQTFDYRLEVENTSEETATGVEAAIELPDVGSFESSTPAGRPVAPEPGSTYVVDLPDLSPGETTTVVLRWRAPRPGDVEARASAVVTADGLDAGAPSVAVVPVGLEGVCNPCGVTAAGTGLRNRSEGQIAVTGVPEGATVTRAVLHWGVLYQSALPASSITLEGTSVTADVTATVSGDLCWGDSNTVGYTADVTDLVRGNGTYSVTDPPRGITRPDSDPAGVLPYTDGTSLVVFYVGGGATSQVLSDFTYGTNTAGPIIRSFDGINSQGRGATLTLAGPDGQGNAGEVFTITGAGSPITLFGTWDGSDPQQGPSFSIGNLWDTDAYDVSSVLPAGQTELTFSHYQSSDCIGVGATVLEVEQE